ncbi:MAG: protease inhibitor I42 family protein [Geobacteraceae bacterium]|nr:protease inhibitor I42 family protein [Geobacteraceae bacterium]
MRSFQLAVFLLAVVASPALSGETAGNSAELPCHVEKSAVWKPGPDFLEILHARCDALAFPQLGKCFASLMKESGASPEALAFTGCLGNEAWLRAFRKKGRVDVAYLTYPFRANENQGVLLVNGAPSPIDIDNLDLLTQDELKQDIVYGELAKRYPDICLWPGDRYGTETPVVESLAKRRLRFYVVYLLRNGCHACEKVGSALFAFDFDAEGKYRGDRLMMVTDTTQEKYSDPSVPVKVKAGEEFLLKLASSPTNGYQWSLSETPDNTVVKFAGNRYYSPTQGRLGSGGVDTWTFRAVGKGRALIFLKYARSWEKDVEPIRQAVFVVEVR